MLTFFAITFTLIFVGLLLHLAYTVDEKKSEKRVSDLEKRSEEFKSKTVDPRKVFGKKWEKGVPRPRICPCCGTPLERHEYLYASMAKLDDSNPKKSVHIYGCKYCYLGMEKESSTGGEMEERPTESLDF